MAGLEKGKKDLKRDIVNKLNNEAIKNDLAPFEGFSPGGLLERIVLILNKRTKERVVILVDEYDAPIQDVINDLNLAEIHRQVLHSFYSTIKTLADSNMTQLILYYRSDQVYPNLRLFRIQQLN